MIPQSISAVQGRVNVVPYPSFTYRLGGDQIVGDTDGLESIRQAVYHILSTERYAYAIYGEDYGVELEKYIGRGFPYLEATIQNTLRDALLQDDRISGVRVTEIRRAGTDTAAVLFDVTSRLGTFRAEVNVNV